MLDYKKISECNSAEYCQGWNEAMNEIIPSIFMKVKCIDDSGIFSDRLNAGEEYYIDVTSLYVDYDGDSLVSAYRSQSRSEYIGQVSLNRFTNLF